MSYRPLSWNRLPGLTPASVRALSRPSLDVSGPAVLYGNGRSYGDVCLTDGGDLLRTRFLDRFISFDAEAGVIRCQGGVTLDELLALVVPQGWFLPVTPGTRYATIGGAIANDVHGKNHHAVGSFGHHVRRLSLVRSDGSTRICSQQENSEWFRATIAGLGLTGLIEWAELKLQRINNPWMWVESHRFSSVDEFWSLNEKLATGWPYTVAWIDCLARGTEKGRGVLYVGQHAPPQNYLPAYAEKSKGIPVQPPVSLVNPLTLRAFNLLYYKKPVKPQGELCHYVPYFYPLDAISNWNRMYGPKGFYQYQCVLPPDTAKAATGELLDQIARSGQGSFLAVLKTFGDMPAAGLLSFARAGATLALDFPNRGKESLALFERLDRVVSEAGGALYPAKDARMPGWLFRQGYPGWQEFQNFMDPALSSNFWKRVME